MRPGCNPRRSSTLQLVPRSAGEESMTPANTACCIRNARGEGTLAGSQRTFPGRDAALGSAC